MKKYILLLIVPLFSFSDEKKIIENFDKTITLSQLEKELKVAAVKKKNYTLKNCKVIFDKEETIKGIHFPDTNFVTIENCFFESKSTNIWPPPTLLFKNCQFGIFDFTISNKTYIKFDDVIVSKLLIFQDAIGRIEIENSDINLLQIFRKFDLEGAGWATEVTINNNDIKHCKLSSVHSARLHQNNFGYLDVGVVSNEEMKSLVVTNNTFHATFDNIRDIRQDFRDTTKFQIHNYIGLSIWLSKANYVNIAHNKFNNLILDNNQDSIFNAIRGLPFNNYLSSYNVCTDTVGFNSIGSKRYAEKYNDYSIINKMNKDKRSVPIEKIKYLENLINSNKKIELGFAKKNRISIKIKDVEYFSLYKDTVDYIRITDTDISNSLTIKDLEVNGIQFSNNSLPSSNKVKIDKNIINKLSIPSTYLTANGFHDIVPYSCLYYAKNYLRIMESSDPLYIHYYGNEDYDTIIKSANIKDFQNICERLIPSLKQLTTALADQGSSFHSDAMFRMKEVITTKDMCGYYNNPTLQNWFYWKGSEFLKIYSDYGMNPFKALFYCFWIMLYFAVFYFFFSRWDVVERGLLIKRFNGVIDYFSSEKRMEDIYLAEHKDEISSFEEFRGALEKNKIQIPVILVALAKPIYHMSFFRHKAIGFFYKKAEFMAGKKWSNLSSKDRYGVGALTVLLSIFYILSLLFVRALNSITLSINVFSTLGFGNIPVKGFTKYIAIIQGFLGWFLLSIFLVSVLNQMVNI